MARGVNKVILIGTLGKDPDLKYTASGSAICNLSVATNESWKDKSTGERKEKTEWHRVTMFNRLAEVAGQHLKKGANVYIEGKLQTRKWQDQSGQDRWTTEIIAGDMQMLGGGGQGGMPSSDSGQTDKHSGGQSSGGSDGGFDDIPFGPVEW